MVKQNLELEKEEMVRLLTPRIQLFLRGGAILDIENVEN